MFQFLTRFRRAPAATSSKARRSRGRTEIGWKWVIGAMAIGAFFLYLPWLWGLDLRAIAERLCEHLGVSFIVTGLAIALYETSAHYQDPIRIAEQLKDLRKDARSHALRKVVRANFRGFDREHGLALSRDVTTIVARLKAIELSQDWAKDVYRDYLVDVLQNVKENADELWGASTRKPMAAARDHSIVLFPPATRTDEILTRLMTTLPNGSEYNVISDIESWKNSQMEHFFAENAQGAKDRVKIRRIFLLDLEASPTQKTLSEARAIIGRHVRAAAETQHYEVRLLDHEKLGHLNCEDGRAPGHIYANHFGLFQHAHDERCIRVRVYQADLTQLYFAILPCESDEKRQFMDVWNHLQTNLTEDQLNEAISRWEARACVPGTA